MIPVSPFRSTRLPPIPGAPAAAVLLALLAALAPAWAGAQTPLADLEPMTAPPEALLAAAAELETEEPTMADVLLQSHRIVFESDGAATVREHMIIRLNDARGVEQLDDLSTIYAPWHEDRPTLRARVVLPNGAVHPLDPATITEGAIESDLPNTYQDRRRLVAPLPAVAPGAIVERVIETVERAPVFEAGTLHRVPILAFRMTVHHARVVVDAPEGMELRFEARPEALATSRTESSDGRTRRVFEARGLEPVEPWLPGLPPDEILYPFVAVSTGRDWSTMARYYSEVVDRQIAQGAGGETPTGASLLGGDAPDAGAESQWEQIAARLAWVHERVRYTGVQLREAAIVPRPPGETLTRRYGDCKDKATLVVALLREIGVPAYVALLRAGTSEDVLPELPGIGFGGFDHAIVHVPGNPGLWIDATDPTAPLGELPTMSQGRLALVASPGTQGLVRTPAAGADDNRIAETREVFLRQNGPARVTVRGVYRGFAARKVRAGWEGVSEEKIETYLGGIAEQLLGSSEVREVDFSELGTPGPMEVSYELEEAPWTVSDLTSALVVVPDGDLLAHLPGLGEGPEDDEDAEGRTVDFYFREPYEMEVLYRIHVPDGFRLRGGLDEGVRSFGPATLERRVEEADGEVRYRMTFRLPDRRISPEQLDALRAEVEEFLQEPPIQIWFDSVGWQHLAAGRIDEAIAEQRRLTAGEPDEPMHLLRLSQILTEIGLVSEAERAVRRAAELAPDDDLVHALLGEILMCDAVCRGLEHGFDRQGALAALRRAHELAPEDSVVRFNLAVALEHDADGRRYRDPAALEEAIELYRGADSEDLEADGYDINLAIDLFHLGRFEEVLELTEDDADDPNLFSFALAAEAALEGADAAIARTARDVRGGRSERATVLAMASQNLLVHRRYTEANALMQAAARSSSGGGVDQEMVELLPHLRRHEEVELDTGGPVGVVLDLIIAFLRGDPDVESLRGHLAGEWIRRAEPEDFEAILDAVSSPFFFPALHDAALPDELFLDLLTSTMTWSVEREEPLGTLVRVKRKAAIAGSEEAVFVIDGVDDPRVVANDETPVVYGRFAYELARAGEAERAAAFLDRALGLFEPSDEEAGVLDSGLLLRRFWSADGPRDADAALLAGAALASGTQSDEELLATLRGAEVPPERQDALDLAVARALIGLERWEELVEPAREIARTTEDDSVLRAALAQSNRLAELAELLEAGLESESGEDAHAARALRAQILSDSGRMDEALDAYSALLALPGAGADAYNNGAWLAVAHGITDERTLAWARRSVELSERPDHARLHTLATALAARGRTLEAYDTLRAAIDANPTLEIEPADWYTLGRIAEHHGFLAAARDYYERIDPPREDDDPTSTPAMAAERLRLLATVESSPPM